MCPTMATRRNNKLQGKKLIFSEGSSIMKQVRLLVMSKRGVAILEHEEAEDDRVKRHAKAFNEPRSPPQIKVLLALTWIGKEYVVGLPATA